MEKVLGPVLGAVNTVKDMLTTAGHFRNVRTTICKHFKELLDNVIQPCCEESEKVITSLQNKRSHEEELKKIQKELHDCRDKTLAIIPILERDKMKAVVFGCTSSGKSTLINAMLDDDVLPTSMGVCSSCLVQIEGCDGEVSSMTLPNGSNISVQDLDELGNTQHLKASETAVVHWPKSKCKLLSNDVLVIDRPGISSDPEVDKIVNDKCSDADVHIFVVDSVASITTESREYFMNIAEKLSKPNIFFVFNKWDESAYETEERSAKIRRQHVESVKELYQKGCLNCDFDINKIYFISAREMIWAKKHPSRLHEGNERREEEFTRFCTELQESLTISAVKTKFGPHCDEGIALCKTLGDLAQGILDAIDHAMGELWESKRDLDAKTTHLKAQQADFTKACENKTEAATKSMRDKMKEEKSKFRKKLDKLLEDIPFEEDDMDTWKKMILDKFEANDDYLHDNIEQAASQELMDLRKEMEDHLPHIDDTKKFTKTPFATGKKLRLEKPRTKLGDAATTDLPIGPPSYTDRMAWFRRRMSSAMAHITAVGGTAVGAAAEYGLVGALGLGTGFGVVALGGAVGVAKYLEYNREAKKKKLIDIIVKKYEKWLDAQERVAQIACHAEAAELAENMKTTVNKTIDDKVESNRNLIRSIERCINELECAFTRLKIYKDSALSSVKQHFIHFQHTYLQDVHDNWFENLESSPID